MKFSVCIVLAAMVATSMATGVVPIDLGYGGYGLGLNGVAYGGLGYNTLGVRNIGYGGLGYNTLGVRNIGYGGLRYNTLGINGLGLRNIGYGGLGYSGLAVSQPLISKVKVVEPIAPIGLGVSTLGLGGLRTVPLIGTGIAKKVIQTDPLLW